MTPIVRDFTPADTDAWIRVRRAAVPFMLTTPESVAFERGSAHPDRKLRMLVVEAADGEVVGTAFADIAHEATEPGQSSVTPYVHPDHRGQGAGEQLLRTAEEHLRAQGATAVYAWVLDAPEFRAFAEKRDYTPTRSLHFQRLDLANATLPPLPPLPAGVELRTTGDFRDDPRPLFDADAEATADEPSDISTNLSDYEDWLNHTWNDPLLDHELSTVVVADGEVASYTAAHTDGLTRYWSAMTGTARAHRGRGFAKLAKTRSLRQARAAGYTDAYTGNDTDNGPMLAINTWFGYEVCATEVRHVRRLGR